MTTRTRILRISIVIGVLGLIILIPGRKIARSHVSYITATEDHPLHCTSCHLYIAKQPLVSRLVNADYYSPMNLAVSPDGRKLYVTAQDGNAILVVDASSQKVSQIIPVGNKPYGVILDKEGRKAFISNQWSDNVMIIDLNSGAVTDTLSTGNGPAGMSLSSDGKTLYVVNSYSSDLSVIDLQTGIETKRLGTGSNPTGIGLSPDGKDIFVSSRRAELTQYGEPLKSDITVVNDSLRRVTKYVAMESAYLMENFAFTPSGDLAFVTLIRPKNLLPTIQVERGWMMNHGFGIIERKENGRIIQLLLDEPNAFYPDPYDIVITSDGKRAFISSSAVNWVSVVNIDSVRKLISVSTPGELSLYANHLGISSSYIEKRIPTGDNPKGLALSPDGKLLFVANHLGDNISVISTESLEAVNTIDLGGTHRLTVPRKGRQLLNNAGHTFQAQYSCYTCHPDEHEDGLIYNMASKDMGRNITNTESLRDIRETAPFKWNGKNQTVYKQDGMRFSTVLTRSEAFSYPELDAISSYIMTGIKYPPNLSFNSNGQLTEAQLRGRKIFDRSTDMTGKVIPENNRCYYCHSGPFFTNRQLADVNTLAASDDSMLFDVPHLTNIYASPPYLHDGRAKTLEEIWTIYGTTDKHGLVNDLTKNQLNDLIEYLKSLRSPDYEGKNANVHNASLK